MSHYQDAARGSRQYLFDNAGMDPMIRYRKMKHGDEAQVSEFIAGVFDRFVAPGFSHQGVDEFLKYIRPDALERRLHEDHFALMATAGSEILGVIEVRNSNHIALFFVDGRFQGRGLGRALLKRAVEICRQNEAPPSQITVNASPNSKTAYEKLGFAPTDAQQCVNGIRFVPMVMRL